MTAYTYQFKIVSSVIMTIRASKRNLFRQNKAYFEPLRLAQLM